MVLLHSLPLSLHNITFKFMSLCKGRMFWKCKLKTYKKHTLILKENTLLLVRLLSILIDSVWASERGKIFCLGFFFCGFFFESAQQWKKASKMPSLDLEKYRYFSDT